MLDSLSLQRGTDKSSLGHNYMHVYQELFEGRKNAELTILEIGVQYGRSVLTWLDYFPNAKIYGIDIVPECGQTVKHRRFEFVLGSATDQEVISGLPDFDIIIDDGSHLPDEQLKSFELLYPKVKDGGHYIVEDIYTHLFGAGWFNFQKELINRVYSQENMSITFHRALTIITRTPEWKVTR